MSSVDLPQKNNSQPGGNLEKIKEEARKAAEVLEKYGKLPEGKGVDKLFQKKEEKKEADKSEIPEKNPEISFEDIETLDRETTIRLMDQGVSDEKIKELSKEKGEFHKFDGSSYYLSNKVDKDSDDNPDRWPWRCRSATGHTSDGATQLRMFTDKRRVPGELKHYRKLLQSFGTADDLLKAISYLESKYKKEHSKRKNWPSKLYMKEDLLKLAESGDYKKAEEQDNKVGKQETRKESNEEKESIPLFERGDLVMWFKPELKANRWEKPKRVKRVKIEDGSVDLFIEGEDVKFPVKTDDGDVQFRIIEKAEAEQEEQLEDKEEFVSSSGEDSETAKAEEDEAEKVAGKTDKEAKEPIKPEKEDGKESQDESIADEIKEKFQEQFNISEEDLRSIPGFAALSAGQQKLVYKNFSKVTLGRIEEQGLMDYREDVAGSGRFSRAWKGFFSTYYKKKEQSLAGEEILSKGIDLHRGALSDIVKQTRLSGLDLNESGNLKFISHQEFAQIADENIPEEVELMSQLNMAAEEFSQVSDEWRYADTFSKAKDSIKKLFGGEVDEYREKLKDYKEALNKCIDHFAKKDGQEGVRRLMEIDKKVRFTQFFESGNDIDYEEALQNIKDEPRWYRLADNVGVEKGAYVALGYIGRTASYLTLSAAAVPAALATAVGIGGYRARSQALEQLREEARLRRGGVDASLSRSSERLLSWEAMEELENAKSLSEGKEVLNRRKEEQNKTNVDVINTVSSESLNEKLQSLLEKINSPETSEEEKENALESLRRRVRYTRIKMEGGEYQEGSEDGEKGGKMHDFSGGLIDYGEAYHRSGHRYELLSTLGEAEATLAVSDPDVRGDIDSRLDRYLNYKNDKVKKYVHKKTGRGAILAGGFASLGAWLGGHWAPEEADQAEVSSPETGSGEVDDLDVDDKIGTNGEGGTEETSSDSTEAAVEQPETDDVPPPPNYETEALGTQDFIIDEKGEGMIHAIADGLEDKYEISHEKAMEIGNKLFIKGEQLKGDDELYNLVGEGATFRLDFADLTEADLEDLSADELVEKIDFDNEDGFDAGESGIKGLELPEEEAATASGESAASTETYDPAVDQYGRYEDSPIETKDIEGETMRGAAEKAQEQAREGWKQDLKDQGIEVKEGSAAEVSADSSSAEAAEAAGESRAETEQPTTANTETEVEALRTDVIERDTTEYINDRVDDLLKSVQADTSGEYKNISVNALGELNEYLDANRNQDIVTTVEKLGQDNPRLLLTLDKVVSPKEGANPPGSLLDRLSGYISNAITKAENDGRLSQALREKIAVDRAHLDALASAEVSPDAAKEMNKEIEGLSSELNQYAEKTNKSDGAKEKFGRLGDAFWQLERASNKAGSDEGARFFGTIKDILDGAHDELDR